MTAKNGHKPGFRLPERTARLVFEGEYEGAEVVVRLSVSLGRFIDMGRLADMKDVVLVAEAFDDFSKDVLVSWNVQGPDGKALEPHLRNAPMDFAMLIFSEWVEAAKQSPLVPESSA